MRRLLLLIAPLGLAVPASAYHLEDIILLSSGGTHVNPKVSDWSPLGSGPAVVWTTAPNGHYDVFLHDGVSSTNVTPWVGNQYWNEIDGPYAVFLDDRNPNLLSVLLMDLIQGAATPMNVDQSGAFAPSVYNPAGSNSVTVAYVRLDAARDIVLVKDFLDVQIVAPPGPASRQDFPSVSGDFVVFQSQVVNWLDRHIWSYQISTGTYRQLTDHSDNTHPHTDGEFVAFTRNGNEIWVVPVVGGASVRLSSPAPGVRDRARISGSYIVWDDTRSGGYDVYFNTRNGLNETALLQSTLTEYLPDVRNGTLVWTQQTALGEDILRANIVP